VVDAEILVVEDNDDLRELTAELVANLGFRVSSAANGAEAMSYLQAHAPPRLILLDQNMPVMAGDEFRRRQLADPRLASVPVLVLTAVDLPRAEEWRGAEVLAKPVDADALASAVRRAVAAGSAGPNVL
jgi:CheY-like chemotaxis protein